MPKKTPIFPGPRTARGLVLAVLLSNADQAGAEPLRGRVTLAAALWERALPLEQRLAVIERALLGRLRFHDQDRAGRLVRSAVGLIERAGGAVRIEALAGTLGVSRQHLALQFRERVGLNAKTFAMVCRFRRASAALRGEPGPGIDWAGLAGECGYYDQSHLIHEFQQFAGETPEAFARPQSSRPG
jgi:AraC-like DNA-binding protein